MQHVYANVEEEFQSFHKQLKRMAEQRHIGPSIPRNEARQMHRNNVRSESCGEYYKKGNIRIFHFRNSASINLFIVNGQWKWS